MRILFVGIVVAIILHTFLYPSSETPATKPAATTIVDSLASKPYTKTQKQTALEKRLRELRDSLMQEPQ